jgi:DNA-binding NarL/FixJ family response regulator
VAAEADRAAGGTDGSTWSAAAAAWRQADEPYPLAYTLLRLAEAQAAVGDRLAAATSVRDAHDRAAEVGARPIVAEAAALAQRNRLDLAGTNATPVGPVAPADPFGRFGLTEREREVLLLLAGGQSNPQIAQTLFISPKTASVHVSNILAKLGVAGRVEAAAVAHRLGVASQSPR